MMQPDTSKWLLPTDGHPSLEQLRLYQQEEELSARSRHQVEKHLLDCELCSDILAGMALSNQAQTQAALNQISKRVNNRVQQESTKKVRPMYGPMLGIAATLVILLVSVGLFRYLQQPDSAPITRENTVAKSSPAPTQSVPVLPEAPIIKPAEPQVEINPKEIRKAPIIAQRKVKVSKPEKAVAVTTDKPQELSFPIDTAAVLDAFAIKTEDTPRAGYTSSTPQGNASKVDLTGALNKVASSLAGKQMGIALRRTGTFTGQRVTGQVTDSEGEPIAGANVVVSGTTTGTTTDAAGKFSLNVPAGKDALTFNYIGYQSQEQKIKEETTLAVKLREDPNSLQEVAVLSYSQPRNIAVEVTRAKPQNGRKEFNQYIRENLQYPVEARQQKQEGRVDVGFTVTEHGALTNFKILKSLSPACDAEAIRLIKEGPAWQPTVMQGQPQPENVQVSVRFKL
ncbi:TonB family protein [Adhaeribacter swui]|uniref:TonB family protein n=1 Tax=Adhaeribacter swui TaxID=2086471 RepID=A0A7G7G6E3_9BACT|nr:energy transducer TonB [Adhaeribacter swui]QNF32727.1 TonB family protein [Adhaeribacter swui]